MEGRSRQFNKSHIPIFKASLLQRNEVEDRNVAMPTVASDFLEYNLQGVGRAFRESEKSEIC